MLLSVGGAPDFSSISISQENNSNQALDWFDRAPKDGVISRNSPSTGIAPHAKTFRTNIAVNSLAFSIWRASLEVMRDTAPTTAGLVSIFVELIHNINTMKSSFLDSALGAKATMKLNDVFRGENTELFEVLTEDLSIGGTNIFHLSWLAWASFKA